MKPIVSWDFPSEGNRSVTMSLRIVVDSVSDIPRSLADELGIVIVPLQVIFEDASYRDGQDFDSSAFFNKVAMAGKLPTTAQVTPGEFIEVFRRELEEGNELLVITMSSALSGTYNAARTAAEFLETDRISLFDSRSVTFGYGLVAVLAARMIRDGADKESVCRQIDYMITNQESRFIVDTLDYLRRGGRLTGSEAFIGGLLNVKPILKITDGVLHAEEKVRGRKKAIRYICDWLAMEKIDLSDKTIALYHADDRDYLNDLEKALREQFKLGEVIYSEVGSVVGTHSGPGCIAISFIR